MIRLICYDKENTSSSLHWKASLAWVEKYSLFGFRILDVNRQGTIG